MRGWRNQKTFFVLNLVDINQLFNSFWKGIVTTVREFPESKPLKTKGDPFGLININHFFNFCHISSLKNCQWFLAFTILQTQIMAIWIVNPSIHYHTFALRLSSPPNNLVIYNDWNISWEWWRHSNKNHIQHIFSDTTSINSLTFVIFASL